MWNRRSENTKAKRNWTYTCWKVGCDLAAETRKGGMGIFKGLTTPGFKAISLWRFGLNVGRQTIPPGETAFHRDSRNDSVLFTVHVQTTRDFQRRKKY